MQAETILTFIVFINVLNIVWLYFDTTHLKHEIKRLQIQIDGVKNVST